MLGLYLFCVFLAGVGAHIEDVTEAYYNKRKEEKNLLRNQILVDVLSREFNSTQEQLDYVLNESLKLTESKLGYIYLYTEESHELILNSWSKDVMAECAVVERLAKYQLEKTGLWGEVVRQRKPIIVNNYEVPNAMKKGYPKGHVQLTKSTKGWKKELNLVSWNDKDPSMISGNGRRIMLRWGKA